MDLMDKKEDTRSIDSGSGSDALRSTPDSLHRKSASKGFKSRIASFQKLISNGGRSLRDRAFSSSSDKSIGSVDEEKKSGATLPLPSKSQSPFTQSLTRSPKKKERCLTHPVWPDKSQSPTLVSIHTRDTSHRNMASSPNRLAQLHELYSSSSAQSMEAIINDNVYASSSNSPTPTVAVTNPLDDNNNINVKCLSPSSSHSTSSQIGIINSPIFDRHRVVNTVQPAEMDRDNNHGLRLHERNVDEYMDARSGADDASSPITFVDEEGVRVRKIKLVSTQNVGFESLPVQFVNKATKSGFVFNILVIGETGVGKSTLINSLFNYDFKLQPGDYHLESVALDKHTFHLEEGSVRLQLTVIETKGYGDQLNMADSWQGVVEYIDKQYEAYFQEESQIMRRLSDYKDTRVHVCLFLLAPTGSSVRALDLECMKVLGNKVNVIPVIARGDSLTKKEMDSFKRRINEQLRLHKINVYKFPEDDIQVADLNRKMNLDVPFAVVGSSEVCEVAGHKTRARVYPWGIVDIENEAHCDFTRFREALLRVNMDHLMQTTHLQHYELYRDRRMVELGYGDVEGEHNENQKTSFIETITRLRQTNENKYRQKEEETRATFVSKVREKETELKERERELHSQYEQRKTEWHDRMLEVDAQRSSMVKEMEIFNRVKSEVLNHPSGTIKTKKK